LRSTPLPGPCGSTRSRSSSTVWCTIIRHTCTTTAPGRSSPAPARPETAGRKQHLHGGAVAPLGCALRTAVIGDPRKADEIFGGRLIDSRKTDILLQILMAFPRVVGGSDALGFPGS
jgi:LPS sulfotransferase NodH